MGEEIDIQAAYRQAKELNGLTIQDVADITGVSLKTAESHLYGKGREPGWKEIHLIKQALKSAGMVIPRQISRFTQADMTRAYRWGKSRSTGNEPSYVGEKKTTPREYIYRGEAMTLSEICKITDSKYHSILGRINARGVNVSSDITDLVDNFKRKKKALYIYRGEKRSLKEIAELVNIKYNALYKRLKKQKIEPLTDITDLIDKG